jgi:hypothetical protein
MNFASLNWAFNKLAILSFGLLAVLSSLSILMFLRIKISSKQIRIFYFSK